MSKPFLTPEQCRFMVLESSDLRVLQTIGLSSTRRLLNVNKMQLVDILKKGSMIDFSIQAMVILQAWVYEDMRQIVQDFGQDEWDDFLTRYHPTKDFTDPSNLSKIAPPTSNKTNPFKVDFKSIVKLPASGLKDNFLEWVEAFLAQLTLANCGELLEDSYTPPSKSSPDYAAFQNKDMWLKNCLISATMGTTAYPNIDPNVAGYLNFRALQVAYYGTDHKETSAKEANKELARLVFSDTCGLSPSGFVAKYQTLMQCLTRGNCAYPDRLARETFLTKITHSAFKAWKEVMTEIDDSTVTLDMLYTKFCNRSKQLLPSSTIGTTGNNEATHVKVNNTSAMQQQQEALSVPDQAAITKAVEENGHLPGTLYHKLLKKQQMDFLKRRRAHHGKTSGPNKTGSSATNLPRQYSTNTVQVFRGDHGNFYIPGNGPSTTNNEATAPAQINEAPTTTTSGPPSQPSSSATQRAANMIRMTKLPAKTFNI